MNPFFKLELDREKNEVNFKVEGFNPIEVLQFAIGICQDAMTKIKPVEEKKIMKPDIKDSLLINKTKH